MLLPRGRFREEREWALHGRAGKESRCLIDARRDLPASDERRNKQQDPDAQLHP
jgi:hypothetical protein